MKTTRFVLAAAALAFAVPAEARQPAAAGECELHVWPSAGLNSAYHGWFHGGIANGAVTGREGYPKVPPKPLEPSAQLPLLDDVRPNELLDLADHRLVVHPEAASSREARGTARIAASDSPCYAELIVDDTVLQQDVVNGSFLKTLFRFRDFGSGALPGRSFGTWVKTELLLFPPKPGQNPDESLAELKAAYKANFGTFAAAMSKPPKRKR